jgi:hypothetical protein
MTKTVRAASSTELQGNSKFQAPNLKQIQNPNDQNAGATWRSRLGFRILDLFEIWSLVLGIFSRFGAWNLGFPL